MNRRDFCSFIALTSTTLKAEENPLLPDSAAPIGEGDGFPRDNYTPFGYLDNPWHTWNHHRSGVLRSIPGIGFSWFYPAGPGGYFSYDKNGIYEAELALEFEIDRKAVRTQADYDAAGLNASHHSKNLLAYAFEVDGLRLTATFVQVNEDALGVQVEFSNTAARERNVRLMARHTCRLGGETWWGRDGLAGRFSTEDDTLLLRSFAAGPVFALTSDRSSDGQFLSANAGEPASWLAAQPRFSPQTSYFPQPLFGALRYELQVLAGEKQSAVIVMQRAENTAAAIDRARASIRGTAGEIARKRTEDAVFWNSAPRLTGDWPAHWRRGWVYDFETLRMMVRRPVGLYKHPWDAMQIQAPRNVLAETSIDMWALSYADPSSAKAVFLGQFQDAITDNVPCMREDGTMNMVAADGSECGTSISWCFPFFCAESIFNRTRDLVWLRRLYPHLVALLKWTLAKRMDSGGFLVGKCSWETGMDASRRFLIEQPTGGELTEFVRLVELQAAAAHAADVLMHFAHTLGQDSSIPDWQKARDTFAARTQELWKDGWFRDFDTRSKQLVTSVPPDPAQSAPAFCGVATAEQKQQMRPTLRKLFDDSRALGQKPAQGWDDGLAWSSLVLPYIESIWSCNERSLAAQVVATIAERIYRSMDRKILESPESSHSEPKLGWPGISCEVWGAHGAFGGEGYGWGAVMPAHIIRNLLGIRESNDPKEIWISPNLPESFLVPGKEYGLSGLSHGDKGDRFQLGYRVGVNSLTARLNWIGSARVLSITAGGRQIRYTQNERSLLEFEASNNEPYLVHLS
jgi:hypothetical protein